MAQGPLITKEVRTLIAEVYDEHPKWVSKEIQQEVHRRLKLEDRPGLKEDWPSLSTIQRELAQIRKNYEEMRSSPLDRPWSLGDLNNYEIYNEAIPILLKIQLNENEKGNRLTVRQVRWIDRLYKSITNIKYIKAWANIYSRLERISELAGFRLDTYEYDMLLTSGHWDPTRFKPSAESSMPDWENLNTGHRLVDTLETMLIGYSLEGPELSAELCWFLYFCYLCQIGGDNWENMPQERKESFVRRLRESSTNIRLILEDVPSLFQEAGIQI